jgi:hypothetical protein
MNSSLFLVEPSSSSAASSPRRASVSLPIAVLIFVFASLRARVVVRDIVDVGVGVSGLAADLREQQLARSVSDTGVGREDTTWRSWRKPHIAQKSINRRARWKYRFLSFDDIPSIVKFDCEASCDILRPSRHDARDISIGVKIGRRVSLPRQVLLGGRRRVDTNVIHTTNMALVRKRTPVVALFLHGGELRNGARRRNSTGGFFICWRF